MLHKNVFGLSNGSDHKELAVHSGGQVTQTGPSFSGAGQVNVSVRLYSKSILRRTGGAAIASGPSFS